MGKTFKDKRQHVDTSRDVFQLMLINGATKASVHKDRKRENNRNGSRDWDVANDNGEW